MTNADDDQNTDDRRESAVGIPEIPEVADEILEALSEASSPETRAEVLLIAAQQDEATFGALQRRFTQIEPYTDADDLAKLKAGAPEVYDEVLNDMRQARELQRIEVEERMALARSTQALQGDIARETVRGENDGRFRGQVIGRFGNERGGVG